MSSVPYSRYLVYPITWYSFLIVVGVILAFILCLREERRSGLPTDTIMDLALWIIPCGIAGARIYYVIFSWSQFRDDLISVLRIWEGGIAIYGGLIGGILALLVFSRRRHISPLKLCDLIAPGLALAQCIGRWGNWFNIEAYGMTVLQPSLCFFPFAVQVPADGYAWHLATFFYESIWDFCVFVSLIILRRRFLVRNGDVFLFYLLLYAAGRLVIEELRMDSLYASSSVRISQLLSVMICITVLLHYTILVLRSGFRSWIIWCIIPIAFIGSVFALIYSISGSFLNEWPTFRIVLFLFSYAIIMISSLVLIRSSLSYQEVNHADN